MAMRDIPDETALPSGDRNGTLIYVRSKIDPHAMISNRDGDVYGRKDGAKWEWPAVKVERKDDRVTITHEAAYCDDVRYEPVP